MKVVIALLFFALVTVQGLPEPLGLYGCSSTSTTSCTFDGEVSDVNYDASLTQSTSWKTIGDIPNDGYAVVSGLISNEVYEFRMCRGIMPNQHTLVIADLAGAPITSISSCATTGPCAQKPWITFVPTAGQTSVIIGNCVVPNTDTVPAVLEFRIQPCPICNLLEFPDNTVDTTLSEYIIADATEPADWIQEVNTVGYLQECGEVSYDPKSLTCPQFEIPQKITITGDNTDPFSDSSCVQTITIHDSLPPTVVCPTQDVLNDLPFPVTSCIVTYEGTIEAKDLVVTMCEPCIFDFPYLDYEDNCKGDPRFGLPTPKSVDSPVPLNVWSVTENYDVQYSQVLMDGSTDCNIGSCPLDMSVLVIVYPNYVDDQTIHTIKLGFTYEIAFASSIQYKDFDQKNKYETEFRLYLQEKSPKPGQAPQIINLQELVYKTKKVNGLSYTTFNVSPATPLKSDTYFLLVQGRNSGVTSVSNPILTFVN